MNVYVLSACSLLLTAIVVAKREVFSFVTISMWCAAHMREREKRLHMRHPSTKPPLLRVGVRMCARAIRAMCPHHTDIYSMEERCVFIVFFTTRINPVHTYK